MCLRHAQVENEKDADIVVIPYWVDLLCRMSQESEALWDEFNKVRQSPLGTEQAAEVHGVQSLLRQHSGGGLRDASCDGAPNGVTPVFGEGMCRKLRSRKLESGPRASAFGGTLCLDKLLLFYILAAIRSSRGIA